ncbi:hypothetical protein AL053_15395 [Pseudomonas savastanoi pv. fraxini]|uniref:hypothetical protein n=2 Tax=Pseudomonas savastanoi TaxID=29438 RepID=UPI0007609F8D|nr:hypothetical protein [Pseudomonas savastanoi]KWS79777.1 hypothetical protein AL053_15395 [Pseudomonas savastanoi pv. fraxini]RMR63631.1 hypothetical protein ALP81_200057 [Pseudomonas savastanoi pv. fraxini]UKL10049.1 hypothetical protein HQ966_00660 [Pseudomonas savastanoi pv. savastanoi]
MTAKNVERDVAISELANHLERDLMPCPAGRTALLTWIEKKLAHIALNPVPTAADATWGRLRKRILKYAKRFQSS